MGDSASQTLSFSSEDERALLLFPRIFHYVLDFRMSIQIVGPPVRSPVAEPKEPKHDRRAN